MKEKAVVGVSGGVDSCASILLLMEKGFDPVPVHLNLIGKNEKKDLSRLKALKSMGLEVLELDGEGLFKTEVMDPFAKSYEKCLTPNPCVICNEKVKFKMLFEFADSLGVEKVATGHYAGKGLYGSSSAITRSDSGGKDQSYMLYRLPSSWIPRIIFPLEGISKESARALVARNLGSPELGQGDSQDICFLDGSLEDYLRKNLPLVPGDMATEEGLVLGRHRGLALYTEGQRKGLGLSGGPWYVVKKDRESNRLIVGRKGDSFVLRAGLSDVNLQQKIPWGLRCHVQYRYRSRPQDGTLYLSGGKGEVVLGSPVRDAALGQSMVFYDGPFLLGGGVMTWTGDK